MSSNLEFRFHKDDRQGILAIQAPTFYAMFQKHPAAPLLDSSAGLYSYGLIKTENTVDTAHAWTLDRTDNARRLVPHSQTRVETQIYDTTLVVAEDDVDAILSMFPVSTTEDWPPSRFPAEKLFRRAGGQLLHGLIINGCATYNPNSEVARVAYVSDIGGYVVGLAAATVPTEKPGEFEVPYMLLGQSSATNDIDSVRVA
ncbi:MAG: hypothetical protein ABIR37_00990 [Candidatus Saccharimonadales bacterium]